MSFNKASEKTLMKQTADMRHVPKQGARINAWGLKPGYAWNPLLGVDRNIPCPCGSGAKFKKCHLLKMPRAIPEDLAAQYKAALRSSQNIQFIEDEKELENEEASQPNS